MVMMAPVLSEELITSDYWSAPELTVGYVTVNGMVDVLGIFSSFAFF